GALCGLVCRAFGGFCAEVAECGGRCCIVGQGGIGFRTSPPRRTRCVLFTGHYEHSIDAKHRLAIPADIRARWNPVTDGAAFFAVPWVGGVIRLYTETDFHQRAGAAPLTLTPDEDEAELQATLFGLSRRLELDAAGRVRIPEDLL